MQPSAQSWFRNAILYQIYPRSFYDTDGDGVGDIQGIIRKLSYLKGDTDSLGVDVIWLSPIYPSPMADFGYDVSDYCNIHPLFGDLDDFKELIEKAHLRGIRVFIDFIPNHTSEEHPWFIESKQSKNNPRRDWYVWRDPKPEGGPPNNWLSVFGGSAWEFDESSGQYYLHSFLKEQPDVNWDNAGLRNAMKQALKYWLEFGVDGFRMDAVYWLSKDPAFRNDPVNPEAENIEDPYYKLIHKYSRKGPKLTEYMNEIADVLHSYPDKFMVVEASTELPDTTSSYLKLYEHIDPSISAPFNFTGLNTVWKASVFKEFIDAFQGSMRPDYIPVYCMSNHDKPRIVARLGKGAARTAAVMQLTLPGMPVIYYGDEIGMDGVEIPPEAVQDPFGKQVPGMGRDPSRTPFQWNASENAGFTTGSPWLPIQSEYIRRNVESEIRDPESFLSLYRNLIALRKRYSSLQHGSYHPIELSGEVFMYIREYEREKILVALNFSDEKTEIKSKDLSGKVIFSSLKGADERADGRLSVRPHEGVLILLEGAS